MGPQSMPCGYRFGWLITVYVLVAIIKNKLDLPVPLYNFLQVLSIMAFKKTPLNQLITDNHDHESMADDPN
jgi:hypothetical protein